MRQSGAQSPLSLWVSPMFHVRGILGCAGVWNMAHCSEGSEPALWAISYLGTKGEPWTQSSDEEFIDLNVIEWAGL